MKSRGVYETPGGTILQAAHRGDREPDLDRGAAHLKDELMPRYAELIYNGFWFSPEREMLQALIDKSQEKVEGRGAAEALQGARRASSAGSRRTASTASPTSPSRKTQVYDQRDAEGFIRLNALAPAPRRRGGSQHLVEASSPRLLRRSAPRNDSCRFFVIARREAISSKRSCRHPCCRRPARVRGRRIVNSVNSPSHAVDLDRAAMLLGDDVVADREAEAGAFAGRLGREERLEQACPVISGAMPVPLSRTRISTASPRSRVVTFSVGRKSGSAPSRRRLVAA